MCVLHTSLLLSITSDGAVNVGVDAHDPRVVVMDTTDASIERAHECHCPQYRADMPCGKQYFVVE